MSSKASLPGAIGLSLLVTQHPKALWAKPTTSKLHSANHSFPFHFLEDVSLSVSDSLQLILYTGLLSLFPSLSFLPFPPSFGVLRTDFLLTRKFYLASNRGSNTDIHKFQSELLIRKILIASKFGKMPCFFQIHKTDETQE